MRPQTTASSICLERPVSASSGKGRLGYHEDNQEHSHIRGGWPRSDRWSWQEEDEDDGPANDYYAEENQDPHLVETAGHDPYFYDKSYTNFQDMDVYHGQRAHGLSFLNNNYVDYNALSPRPVYMQHSSGRIDRGRFDRTPPDQVLQQRVIRPSSAFQSRYSGENILDSPHRFSPLTFRRPATTTKTRSLSWTVVDDINQMGPPNHDINQSPRETKYRPHTANYALGLKKPSNLRYGNQMGPPPPHVQGSMLVGLSRRPMSAGPSGRGKSKVHPHSEWEERDRGMIPVVSEGDDVTRRMPPHDDHYGELQGQANYVHSTNYEGGMEQVPCESEPKEAPAHVSPDGTMRLKGAVEVEAEAKEKEQRDLTAAKTKLILNNAEKFDLDESDNPAGNDSHCTISGYREDVGNNPKNQWQIGQADEREEIMSKEKDLASQGLIDLSTKIAEMSQPRGMDSIHGHVPRENIRECIFQSLTMLQDPSNRPVKHIVQELASQQPGMVFGENAENDKPAGEHDSQHMSPKESSSLFCEGSVTTDPAQVVPGSVVTDALPYKIPRTTSVTFERKKQSGDAAVLQSGFDVLSQDKTKDSCLVVSSSTSPTRKKILTLPSRVTTSFQRTRTASLSEVLKLRRETKNERLQNMKSKILAPKSQNSDLFSVRKCFRSILNTYRKGIDAPKRREGEFINLTMLEHNAEEFDGIKGCNANAPRDWRRKRYEVEKVLQNYRARVCMSSLLGFCTAVLVNELIYAEVHPRDARIDFLKLSNSILTGLSAFFVVQYYRISVLLDRIYDHTHRLKPLDVKLPIFQIFIHPYLWLELCILLPHCPPLFTTSIGVNSMANWSCYRIESIGASYNVLRTYTLWRYYCYRRLQNLPKSNTISDMTGVEFNSKWVIKDLLDGWDGVQMLIWAWLFSLLTFGYIFKVAEVTACSLEYVDHPDCEEKGTVITYDYGLTYFPVEDEIFWGNFWWMMFITTMTVGYGDVLVMTHFGRIICVLIAVMGIVFASLLTAALSHVLQWTPEEINTLMLLERDNRRETLRTRAVDTIIRYWRAKHPPTYNWFTPDGWRKFFRASLYNFRYNTSTLLFVIPPLRTLKKHCEVDIESLTDEYRKIHAIHSKMQYLESGMYHLTETVRELLKKTSDTTAANLFQNQGVTQRYDLFFKKATETQIRIDVRRGKLRSQLWNQSIQATKKGLKPAEQLGKALVTLRTASGVYKFSGRTHVMSQETKETIAKKVEFISSKHFSWTRKLKDIHDLKDGCHIVGGLFGMCGTVCGIGANEWMMTGGSSEDVSTYTGYTVIDSIKALNSFCTVVTLICLLRSYYLEQVVHNAHMHVHRLHDLHGSFWNTGYWWLINKWLWLEMIVVGIHNPPGYSMNLVFTDMGSKNISVMRSETMMASVNMLRLYLLWRILIFWLSSDLRKRHTLMGFQEFKIGSIFALKRLLNSWWASVYLSGMWFSTLFLLAYWYRSVEVTACLLPGVPKDEHSPSCDLHGAMEWVVTGKTFTKVNDYYLYNAFWLMIITSTSVGYGDIVPTTSLGRVVAGIAASLGFIVMTFLTSSMSNQLTWTHEEVFANGVLDREHARLKRFNLAAEMIQCWYRNHLVKAKTPRKSEHLHRSESRILKRMFIDLKLLTNQSRADLDDSHGFEAKLDLAYKKVRAFEESMTDMGHFLWYNEAIQNICDGQALAAVFMRKSFKRTKNGRGAEFLNQKIEKTLKTKEAIGDKSDEKLYAGNTADRKSSFRENAMHASVLTD